VRRRNGKTEDGGELGLFEAFFFFFFFPPPPPLFNPFISILLPYTSLLVLTHSYLICQKLMVADSPRATPPGDVASWSRPFCCPPPFPTSPPPLLSTAVKGGASRSSFTA